jgi:hypothetical protein
LIGKTNNGFFDLTYTNYKENFNLEENISLFGRLGNCFNEELFFDKYWKAFEIKEYYFSGESVFNFKTKITPHNPIKRELIGFIQPEKVNSELNSISIKGSTLDDLSEINKYLNNKINYVKDWDFHKETNYWQTPLETLELEKGDCEEFSTTLLSLFLSYNSSLNCYNIVFSSHVTTFCYIQDHYIYYDQKKTELKRQIKNKADPEQTKTKLTELENDYFKSYGIEDDETRPYYAFNNNQFIEFENNEEFIDWQYNLKESKSSLPEELEQETAELPEKYIIEELRTEKPSVQLRTEKPTLKGFFKEKITLLLTLFFISFILIIILIKINIKK